MIDSLKTKAELLEILPTRIFSFECPDQILISETLSSLEKEKWKQGPEGKFDQSISYKLHKEEEYKKLYTWFDLCLEFVRKNLALQCDARLGLH